MIGLSDAAAETIVAHARRARPEECCGLLIGNASTIVEARPARNVSERPVTRYRIDPRDHFVAIRDARARGLDVVGAYHSHPASPARPSETDRGEAFADFLFLIVSLVDEISPEMTGWSFEAGNFVPVSLVRTR